MTTTAQAFNVFLANTLSPTALQAADVAAKKSRTAQYLSAAFPASSDLPFHQLSLIGSVGRGTAIKPLRDIDVLAVFDNKGGIFGQYRFRSQDFLQRVRRGLNARTSIRNIGARGQVVRLMYASGAHVDIAPVFNRWGGGYLLPSGTGRWIATDPIVQARWFAIRKGQVGPTLPNIVRLAKRWNQTHSSRLASYHLEVMVASMFPRVGLNYRLLLKSFFDVAPRFINVVDPAGHSGYLATYLTWASRRALTSRFREASLRAASALAAEAAGNHAEAKRLWAIELGPGFPTGA